MTQSLEEAISETIKQQFADATIADINMQSDEDSDGEPILRITVVFASEMDTLQSHKLAGLVRHVRPKLIEHDNPRFPIFRFISKRDNDSLRHEAA